jgi:hypothetical protein
MSMADKQPRTNTVCAITYYSEGGNIFRDTLPFPYPVFDVSARTIIVSHLCGTEWSKRYLPSLSLYFSKTIGSTKIVQTPFTSESQAIYMPMFSLCCPFTSTITSNPIPKFDNKLWRTFAVMSKIWRSVQDFNPYNDSVKLCLWRIPTKRSPELGSGE